MLLLRKELCGYGLFIYQFRDVTLSPCRSSVSAKVGIGVHPDLHLKC